MHLPLKPRLPMLPLDQRPAVSPAHRYLGSLGSDRSRKAMSSQLAKIVCWVFAVPVVVATGKPLGGYAKVNLGAVPWSQLDVDHLQAIRQHLRDSCSPATATLALQALRGVLREVGALDESVLVKHTKAVRGQGLPKVATIETTDVGKLIAAAAADTRPVRRRSKEHEQRAGGVLSGAIVGLLALGLRRSEAVQLQLADYSAGVRKLRVRKSKTGDQREVDVPDEIAALLDRWIVLRGLQEGALLLSVNRGGRIGEAMGAHAVYRRLQRLAGRAGLESVSPHALRRWLAGEIIAVSDVSTCAHVLGHRSVQTSMRYDRAPSRRAHRAMHALDLSSWSTAPT